MRNMKRLMLVLGSAGAALIVTACGSSGVAGNEPGADPAAMRPNGSSQVKVVFTDGNPAVVGSDGKSRSAAPSPGGAEAPDDRMMAQPELRWTPPKTWNATQPASQMRLAQYAIPRAKGDDADGELAVFHLGGGGGGPDETFQRWQAAFDAEAIKGAKRSESQANGMKVYLLELAGKYRVDQTMASADAGAQASEKAGMRLLGAIVVSSRGPYFFKLLGPDKTVAAARADFLQMIDSSTTKP